MRKGGRHGRVAELGDPPQSPSDVREDARTGPVHRRARPDGPELVRRRENRRSTIKSGRTIGEARERLETANERAAARKKDKRKKTTRVIFTSLIFLILIAVLIYLYFQFFKTTENVTPEPELASSETYSPTIEIIDEDSATTKGEITSRMRDFIGKVEADFKELNYTPVKAVIPVGSIREVDFYLDGYSGYLKMTIDRDPAVSVEDADRMLRYLSGQGIDAFEYIDVRIDRRAYWK